MIDKLLFYKCDYTNIVYVFKIEDFEKIDLRVGRLTWSISSHTIIMSEAFANESRPALLSEPSSTRVFTSHVQSNMKEDVECAQAQHCSTFPTDQVPQPVPRDTIVLTTMAAPTDSRGAACLPQSAPTVQAQVTSTGCVSSCDDCTQATLHQYHHGLKCPMDPWGDRAGSPTAQHPSSVISSSSCPASTRPNLTSHQDFQLEATSAAPYPSRSTATKVSSSLQHLNNSSVFLLDLVSNPSVGGNSNLKSINKRQSVKVNCSLAANNNYNNVRINYKGNDYNIIWSETAVTEPNNIEPQRKNNSDEQMCDVEIMWSPLTTPNNNISVKLLDVVNVNNKNVNKHGALILFPITATTFTIMHCCNNSYNNDNKMITMTNVADIVINMKHLINIPDNDIPVVLLPTVQGNKYSTKIYYPPISSFKQTSEIDYALHMDILNMSNLNAESECKSGTVFNTHEHNTIKDTKEDDNDEKQQYYENAINDISTTNYEQNDDSLERNDNDLMLEKSRNELKFKPKYTFEMMIDEQRTSFIREQILLKNTNRPRLRLCGGGESSLNTGTSGWGTPPAANANNNNGNNSTGWGTAPNSQNSNNQNSWNNNPSRNGGSGPGQGPPNTQDGNATKSSNLNANASQNANQNQPPPVQSGSNQGWNQNSTGATAKPPGTNAGASNSAAAPGSLPGGLTQGVATPLSTKQQLEQLNSMREALFSHDGWGGQHVNQDTNWDIPSSPEPTSKEGPGGSAPLWKPPVNNGTELWEANLRNGGQPPPQPVQKTPWGHTPTTNIGGTWGEDDDGSETSNVWTGVPNNPQQWGGAAGGNANNSAGMWGGPKKENDWGANNAAGAGGSGAGWGDPRGETNRAMDPRETIRAIDPRSSAITPVADPRESMRMIDQMRDPLIRGLSDIRGDPRGISGRLNGDAMWGPPPSHHMGHHEPPGKMVGPAPNGVNQWSVPPPKDMGMTGKPSGWEEPSPPSQRRNMPNFDDGTSLWGNPNQQPNRMSDIPTGAPMGGRGATCPPGLVSGGRKPTDSSLWGRNGSWGDEPPQHWREDTWTKPKTPAMAPWESDLPDWHKQGPTGPKLTKEFVWGSKQFRSLVEMGVKKEEAENALRLRDMSFDEALDMLRLNGDAWRGNSGGSVGAPGRHEEHMPYDHTGNNGPYGQRFGPGGPGPISFPPGGNTSNIINNMAGNGGNPSLAPINNMSPAVMQKIFNASGTGGSGAGSVQGYNSSGTQGRTQPPQTQQSQPSTQQLRMLVQQIQMAVQAGYLNHQILNQPLAPQTLILLNQLLQHIKLLQTLMQQQTQQNVFTSQGGKPNSQAIYSVQITKAKQQISNLQNQIAANQAIYVKQQMNNSSGASSSDFYKNMHEPMSALQGNFSDLSINKEPPASYASQQQSRLSQWIKSDKDDGAGVEFSRAPGSVSKPPITHSSPSMNLGLGQSDGPWSTGRAGETGGWPDAGPDAPDGSGKDAWPAPQPSPAAFTDLVPEFEPGKPWKGTQMKSIEDDPSITPGSVVRSPLSLATIKDTEIFSAAPSSATVPSKPSPPVDAMAPLSICSSTWSFNPSSSTTTSFNSLNKIAGTKGTWLDSAAPQQSVTSVQSELWGAPVGKSRGPPPGLVKGGLSSSGVATNGWSSLTSSRSGTGNWSSGGWGSPWLLLRNLTAQIDGSTLQTLCKQHGPLQSFHLYLNNGFALAKYSSREEAIKAQTALNNCVLGNTTILAESPGESEVTSLIQNLSQQSGSSSAAWRPSSKTAPSGAGGNGADTWGNTGWPPNPSATTNLWGATPSSMDSDAQRATPSSLNSFLPGDLLGGESM